MDFFAYLENPDLLHEGTEPNRAYYIPYGERMPAAPADRKDSDRVVWLSGEWGFRYYESLAGEELFIRFDVVEVFADRVRHIENAFGA